MSERTQFSILIDKGIYAELGQLASARERSVGAEVRLAILAHLNEAKQTHGFVYVHPEQQELA